MKRTLKVLFLSGGLLLSTRGAYTFVTTDTSGVWPTPSADDGPPICPPEVNLRPLVRKAGSGAVTLLGIVISYAAFASLARRKAT